MCTQPTLYGAPVVQKRVTITRPPAPPIEDSDVLVLNSRSTLPDSSTVGAQVLYLDIRLSLPTVGSACVSWAFAGLRETVPLDEMEEDAVRYRWKHTIDSHGRDEPPDEGTMVKRRDKNGESIEIETGVSIDPETGKMGPYEEVWKSEHIPSGTPFAFLISDQDPDRSTGFMGILGPHAMGLWQGPAEEAISTTYPREPRRFHAVRLRSDNERFRSEEGKLHAYSKMFSTGYQMLDDQLGKFVDELLAHEREGKGLWKRGERLTLWDSRGRALTWTVWDAAHVDN